jgi:hypothetical protein
MLQSSKKSIRKLSHMTRSIQLKKKSLRLHPYKITAVHEMKHGDSAKRVAYFKWFLDFLDCEGKDILDVTFFTDEATSICRSTSTLKTHVYGVHIIPMRSTSRRCMMRRLVFELVRVSRRRIVGPICFSEALNSQRSCDKNCVALHCATERR